MAGGREKRHVYALQYSEGAFEEADVILVRVSRRGFMDSFIVIKQ